VVILFKPHYKHMGQDTQNTALLVMDMQTAILGSLADTTSLIANVSKAMAAARSNEMLVIYVVVGFREGMPEISMNNKGFAASKGRFAGISMDEFLKIEPGVAPLPGEVVVVKRRVCAFTGSDLEVILRSLNVQHLVLTGIATGGVVLATLIEAADKDYRLTVLSDCCADPEEEVHQLLLTKIFNKRADILTVEEWA